MFGLSINTGLVTQRVRYQLRIFDYKFSKHTMKLIQVALVAESAPVYLVFIASAVLLAEPGGRPGGWPGEASPVYFAGRGPQANSF